MSQNKNDKQMQQDVGGILPPRMDAPGPLVSYFTRPMVPSPASRRRDTLKGIAQLVPFLGGAIAKAEGDKLGEALSYLDVLGGASVPAKMGAKGITSLISDLQKQYDNLKIKRDSLITKANKEQKFFPEEVYDIDAEMSKIADTIELVASQN